MSVASALSEDQLQGFGVLAGACASALVSEPDECVVGAMRQIASALGDARFDDVVPNAQLVQRFYDRFFVSTSPFYVPLHESCIVGARMSGNRMQYAPTNSSATDHVLGCYRAVEFDFRCVEGYELSMKALRPDSMAAELAFMASLADAAARPDSDVDSKLRSVWLLEQFARKHPARWFGKVAECLIASEDDFYARIGSFASESVLTLFEV